MKKVRYVGGSDQRILSEDDMATLGFDDHPGLWFTPTMRVHELEDDVAAAVLGLRDFIEEPTDEALAEDLVEEKSKDTLLAEARNLGITGTSKMTKEELAEAIVAKQAETESIASANEGAELEPHA